MIEGGEPLGELVGVANSNHPLYVLDASVAVKWHLRDEEFVQDAITVLDDYRDGRIRLIAPTHIYYEVGSAVRNAILRQPPRLTPQDATDAIQEFVSWRISTVSSDTLVLSAMDVSLHFNCSYYDGLYVALAHALDAYLVHADKRLHERLDGRFPYELWIEHYTHHRIGRTFSEHDGI